MIGLSVDFSAARASEVFVEASSELGAVVSIGGKYFACENKSRLSHSNDDTAMVRISHYTQCIAA